jgi:hypothetical protein
MSSKAAKRFPTPVRYLGSLVLGFNLVSVKFLSRLDFRQFAQACRRAFLFAMAVDSVQVPEIPTITVDEILGSNKFTLSIDLIKYEEGMLPCSQALALLAVLAVESPDEVLEIGTYMGHTTLQMAENLPSAIIHTVDLPERMDSSTLPVHGLPLDDFHLIQRRRVGRDFQGRPCAARIRQHFADTAQWDFSEAGHPSLFFIDGSHTYEYCRNDSEKCFALCGGQGVFLWHDCDDGHPGVVRMLVEWRRQGRDIRRIDGTPIAYWKSA